MEKKYFAESELIINEDDSIFHLHVKPEQLADKVILVGDPGRVTWLLLTSRPRSAPLRAASSAPLPAHTRASA